MSSPHVLLVVTGAVLAILVAPAAHAQTQPDVAVYASDTGAFESIKVIPVNAPEDYDLYVDKLGATTSTTACDELGGDGDEICGYDVLIQLEGEGHLSDFLEDIGHASVIEYFPEVFTSTTKELRITFADVNPVDAQPLPLGRLTVDATGRTGATTLRAVGNGVVAAGLNLESVPDQVIALPEPSGTVLLVTGVVGLAALYRLRRPDAPRR